VDNHLCGADGVQVAHPAESVVLQHQHTTAGQSGLKVSDVGV